MEEAAEEPSAAFVACPVHDGRLDAGTARALFANASRVRPIIPVSLSCGALAHNFNLHLCMALNARESEGIRWFAMLHSDVEPADWWLDTLIDEAERVGADLMSATVALKDNRGLTSTAMSDPADDWSPACRLSMAQIWHESFPETFDAEAARVALASLPGELREDVPAGSLLEANVGCFVYRLDRPWSDRISFDVRHRIAVDAGGHHRAEFQSDDWIFSRDVAAAGGRVFCTRKVKTVHKGGAHFVNDHAWGTNAADFDCRRIRAAAAPRD